MTDLARMACMSKVFLYPAMYRAQFPIKAGSYRSWLLLFLYPAMYRAQFPIKAGSCPTKWFATLCHNDRFDLSIPEPGILNTVRKTTASVTLAASRRSERQ
jgi:hypothetical protein